MKRARLALPFVLLVLLAACKPERPPVAKLGVTPDHLDLGWPAFTEIQISLEPLADLPGGDAPPILFLHLLDEPGSVVRTFDHPLPQPWQRGRTMNYSVRVYQSALGEPLHPGDYLLTAGLYRPGRERYALRTKGEEVGRYEYRVAGVTVSAASDRMPHARFSEHWLPPQAGTDRQVVARRTLTGGSTGTIQFGPVDGAGRLMLAFVIPESAGSSRLEVLDGGTLPKVRLTSSCGGGQPEVSGVGRFQIDLDVPSAGATRLCDITVAPNFQVTSTGRAEATSVVFEGLSWGAAADEPAD
jgi:hypothetical protein